MAHHRQKAGQKEEFMCVNGCKQVSGDMAGCLRRNLASVPATFGELTGGNAATKFGSPSLKECMLSP